MQRLKWRCHVKIVAGTLYNYTLYIIIIIIYIIMTIILAV